MAAIVTIRDANTGGISPALNAADVTAAILHGDDIVVNGQTAVLTNIGGPSGTWLVNGQPIDSFFAAAASGGTPMPTPTPAQVCSGLPLAPPLPTPAPWQIANLPATITLPTAPILPPQPSSSSLPPAGCVTLVVGGRQRASASAMDMQAAITAGASVLRGDGSYAVIQSLTAPGWPAHNWLIDGNPITAVLGQGFLPGQLDLIHSLAAQGLTISATLESTSTVTYPPAATPLATPPPPPGSMPSPVPVGIQTFTNGTAPSVTQGINLTWIIGGAVLLYLLSRK